MGPSDREVISLQKEESALGRQSLLCHSIITINKLMRIKG